MCEYQLSPLIAIFCNLLILLDISDAKGVGVYGGSQKNIKSAKIVQNKFESAIFTQNSFSFITYT